MKKLYFSLRFSGALALTLLALGCTTTQQSTESSLASAGFRSVTANTPQRTALVASLPVGKMSTVEKDGKTWFVYPTEPAGTALVGTEAQFVAFRQALAARNASNARNFDTTSQWRTVTPRSGGPGWNGFWGGTWGWR
jgi:hypothetical protein